MLLVRLFLFIFVLVVVAMQIKIIREDQRAAVFRLGHFFGVRGPGVVFVIPFVDKIERVDLKKSVPQWRSLTKTELETEIKTIVLGKSEARLAERSGAR